MNLRILLPSLFVLASGQQGSQVSSPEARVKWWESLTSDQQDKLTSLYDTDWFASIDIDTQIAYVHLADAIYDFINSDADAHDDDSYQSFAPILLRTAFHSSGTYFLPDGSGGSKGGTIFQHGELQDGGNGCIGKATAQLNELFQEHDAVPLSDAVIIAATVALDVMEFPRMDLVRVAGGRDMIDGVAFRDRLPSADDDPLELFTSHYGLTLPELVGLIGGAHNFGSAHGKCSGYVGQWTSTPLSWFGVNGTDPTFFTDLLQEDWRWYEVCTYHNDTVVYKSIDDPFNSGAVAEEEEEHDDVDLSLSCPMMHSRKPLLCENQAMRGCDFKDGVYNLGVSPCDASLLQMRLSSDFFLKENPYLLPHTETFAEDADLLAAAFGTAFRKVTHLGMDRCGMNGHGCRDGTTCEISLAKHEYKATSGSEVCALDEGFMEKEEQFMSNDIVRIVLFAAALIVMVCITSVYLMWNKMQRAIASANNKSLAEPESVNGSSEIYKKPKDEGQFLEM